MELQILTHYTDQTGYEGILSSNELRPSDIEGRKHTHYGKGVYFSPLDNADIGILPPDEAVERIFSRVSPDGVKKMQYFVSVTVDPKWNAAPVVDPDRGFKVGDIWLVPQETPINIAGRIVASGPTAVQSYFNVFRSGQHASLETLYTDYANHLNAERRKKRDEPSHNQTQPEEPRDKAKRKTTFAFVGGQIKKVTLVDIGGGQWALE